MEFDKSRVYTALNADELKVGSRVAVAETISNLKKFVETEDFSTLSSIEDETVIARFRSNTGFYYPLAYLVKSPEEKKLKCVDLKVGDVIKHKLTGVSYMITGLDEKIIGTHRHIYFAGEWSSDDVLTNYEKVEE